MAAVAITRTELDSAGLRAAAAGSSDAKQARRLLALAMVLDGHPRLMAAQAGGMNRQTLRDWVHRYNEHGTDGAKWSSLGTTSVSPVRTAARAWSSPGRDRFVLVNP